MALLKLGLNVPFRAALEAAERRKSLMPGTYYALPAEMRAQAFTVSGLTAIDQVQSVLDELKRTLDKGGTFRDFKRWAASNDVGLPGHRLETIFRNGVQQAYNSGHWRRFERDSDERPYLMYDAINDTRTRPAHRALDGVIRPVGDAFWRTHSPALGHRCLLPGTRIKGEFQLGMRTRYTGPAVEIRTATGKVLSVTANHPVLTRSGWVRADSLKDSDDLLADALGIDWQLPGAVDDDQTPPTVEQVFQALSVQAMGVAPVSAFDFHGDAKFGKGDVHIAGADCMLMHGAKPAAAQTFKDRRLVGASGITGLFSSSKPAGDFQRSLKPGRYDAVLPDQPLDVCSSGSGESGDLGDGQTGDLVKRYHLGFKIVIGGSGHLPGAAALPLDAAFGGLDTLPLQPLGIAAAARFNTVADKEGSKGVSADALTVGEGLFTLSTNVGADHRGRIGGLPSAFLAWSTPQQSAGILARAALDSGIAEKAAKQDIADPKLFEKLADVFASDVTTDKVLSVRDFTFDGHVYDFQTRQGVMLASGVIVSNCRCRLLSLSQDEARSRGGVTQNPPAEGQPDPGWGAKPTDYRPPLQAAISRRRSQCEVSQFADKPLPPIWCDGHGAKLLGKLAASAADPKPRAPMPQMVRDMATLQLARDATDPRGFKDRTLTLGPVTPTRELYEATGEDDRSLFVASVALQASYLRRTLAKTGDARIEPRLMQFAYQAAMAGGFSAAPGSAGNPLVMNVFPVAGVLLRWVWEVRPGRRALVLRDVRPA